MVTWSVLAAGFNPRSSASSTASEGMNLQVAQHRPQSLAIDPIADYILTSKGQVHRLQSSGGSTDTIPLYALHGTAYSGRSFAPLMAQLPGHRVAALDTPGYGGSSRPSEPWPLERYADALTEAIEGAGETRIDLLGYHTGAFLAVRIAAARPDLVRRLILIGIPYFADLSDRETWRQRLAAPMTLTEDLEQFEERWDYLVSNRARGADLAKGFDNFVDELRAYPYGFWAHEAAFTFEPEPSLREVAQPTLVINPANPLAQPSRAAAALMRQAKVVELPHLQHGVLDVAAKDLAGHIAQFTKGG
jgi:pimeloyl-ACP methyl ester carboxylesterase